MRFHFVVARDLFLVKNLPLSPMQNKEGSLESSDESE